MKEKNNKQKHYLIYQITNLANGKIYIGKHETFNIEDNYFGSGKYLKRAINKYGFENFEFRILIDLKNKEEMNLLEKMVVTEEFCKRKDVYNIKVGGEGGWDEVNKNPANTGSNHFFKNKTIKEISEIGRKGGLASAKRIQNMTPFERQQLHDLRSKNAKMGFSLAFLGRKHTIETKRRMSASRAGKCIGKDNGSFGSMWICNDLTKESVRIMKTDPIPEGWRKGRICKK